MDRQRNIDAKQAQNRKQTNKQSTRGQETQQYAGAEAIAGEERAHQEGQGEACESHQYKAPDSQPSTILSRPCSVWNYDRSIL